jgi:hypothetical protein
MAAFSRSPVPLNSQTWILRADPFALGRDSQEVLHRGTGFGFLVEVIEQVIVGKPKLCFQITLHHVGSPQSFNHSPIVVVVKALSGLD